MPHLRDQKVAELTAGTTKPKHRNPQIHGHFDADELTRRLERIQKEQRFHADRKRNARLAAAAAKAVPDQSVGREDGPGGISLDGKPISSAASQSAKSNTGSGNLIADLRLKSAKFSLRRSSKSDLIERGANEPASSSHYHHVPQEAASQFTRTTTVDAMKQPGSTHKLAKHALKYHREGVKAIRTAIADPNLTPSEQAKVLRHEQFEHQKNLDRNQFQCTRFLEEAAERDEEREREKQRFPHTWGGELAKLKADDRVQQQKNSWRRSTGDVLAGKSEDLGRRSMVVMEPLADIVEDTNPSPSLPERFIAQEHRIDWTQGDMKSLRRSKLFLQPILRKADSILALKGRRGSKESPAQFAELAASPDQASLKPTKAGFFAKLKRS